MEKEQKFNRSRTVADHRNRKKVFSKTQTIRQCILQNATLLECLAGIWKRCNFKFYVSPILIQPGYMYFEKMRKQIILNVLFYFFLHKLSKRLPCMFLFIVTILLLSRSPSYIQIRKWI